MGQFKIKKRQKKGHSRLGGNQNHSENYEINND
jgi:hypothetical protein